MTRRVENVVRRRRAGPSRGETRWRWSSVEEMVRPEVREPSQDWELNIIRPDQGRGVNSHQSVNSPLLGPYL